MIKGKDIKAKWIRENWKSKRRYKIEFDDEYNCIEIKIIKEREDETFEILKSILESGDILEFITKWHEDEFEKDGVWLQVGWARDIQRGKKP